MHFLSQCSSDEKKINIECLVVPDTYNGPIIIFYGQNEAKGHIEFKDGKHFFFIDSIGVFFVEEQLGEGIIESVNPKFENNYSSSMSINESPDDVFRVVGGAYRGYKTSLYKQGSEFLRYSIYKAGIAKDLKNGGWNISDSIVLELYNKYK